MKSSLSTVLESLDESFSGVFDAPVYAEAVWGQKMKFVVKSFIKKRERKLLEAVIEEIEITKFKMNPEHATLETHGAYFERGHNAALNKLRDKLQDTLTH